MPVSQLDLGRYTGRWYEIARLDHRFERGLTDVRATYAVRPDGTVAVVNEGWDPDAGAWRRAEGTARRRGEPGGGSLEVSFFGPFRGGYHVVAIDPGYGHALVAGPSRRYLWILAREPRLSAATRAALVGRARDLGFAVEDLVWVEHGVAPAP